MFRRNQQDETPDAVDDQDERPPSGYRSEDEADLDLGLEEDDDGRERRRDPLRKI